MKSEFKQRKLKKPLLSVNIAFISLCMQLILSVLSLLHLLSGLWSSQNIMLNVRLNDRYSAHAAHLG